METGARYLRFGTHPSNIRGSSRAAIYTLWSSGVLVWYSMTCREGNRVYVTAGIHERYRPVGRSPLNE